MNKRQKSKFVRDLTKAVTKQILDRVPDMPEEWDAIELRQYVADMFERNWYTGAAHRNGRPSTPECVQARRRRKEALKTRCDGYCG